MADTSILISTKELLGIEPGVTHFDSQIVLHINSVFSILNQLAVGPTVAFEIEDDSSMWSEFIYTTDNINSVKTYMYLKVRLLFDPPTLSFMIDAIKEQIKELEWRLNTEVEETKLPTEYPTVWDLTGGLEFPAEAPIGAVGIDLLTGNIWLKE